MNRGRLTGIILITIGFGIALVIGLFLAVQAGNDELGAGGAILGAGLGFLVIAPLIGFGIYLYVKGGQEAEEESVMEKQRQLLDIIKSRGQVTVEDLALEMRVSVNQVQNMVHQLVGLQVFSGYVNWDDGILYSSEASQLRELDSCRKCGAPIQLVGKGTVACKYCGTEYFMS